MFVTHYPLLAEMEVSHPGTVGNFHMSYVEAETTSKHWLYNMSITIYYVKSLFVCGITTFVWKDLVCSK